GLGLRIIIEQEELAEKHASDERRLTLDTLERSIVTRLDRLKQQAAQPAAAGTPDAADEIALVAAPQRERVMLPGDDRAASTSLRDPAFASAIDAAEREEFSAERLDRAETLLRAALRSATTREQSLEATLLLARVLGKRNRDQAAEDAYSTLLH